MMIFRADESFFEGRAGGDDLERRSGLVEILDGPIATGGLGSARVAVGIERRGVGEGQDLAGCGVHDDDRSADGTIFLHALPQFALGDALEVLVDGQFQRRTCRRLALDVARHDAALGVQLDENFAREAADDLVRRRFDAGQADVIDADVAEHVRPAAPAWDRSAGSP